MKKNCHDNGFPEGATNASCGCCEGTEVLTPLPIANRPGLSELSYRVGTHGSFLETMKARLSSVDYSKLADLTTRDSDDPSIALLDAWATVADVLTFYQERIANEGYLRTATEQRSIEELGRLVGYQQRPGISASTYLAYSVEEAHKEEVTIPAGSRVQSVPGQDELPQTFESSEDLKARAEWNNLAPRVERKQTFLLHDKDDSNVSIVYLRGINTNLKLNDRLLLEVEVNGIQRPELYRVLEVTLDDEGDRTCVALALEEQLRKSKKIYALSGANTQLKAIEFADESITIGNLGISIYLKGDQTNLELEQRFLIEFRGVEEPQLYRITKVGPYEKDNDLTSVALLLEERFLEKKIKRISASHDGSASASFTVKGNQEISISQQEVLVYLQGKQEKLKPKQRLLVELEQSEYNLLYRVVKVGSHEKNINRTPVALRLEELIFNKNTVIFYDCNRNVLLDVKPNQLFNILQPEITIHLEGDQTSVLKMDKQILIEFYGVEKPSLYRVVKVGSYEKNINRTPVALRIEELLLRVYAISGQSNPDASLTPLFPLEQAVEKDDGYYNIIINNGGEALGTDSRIIIKTKVYGMARDEFSLYRVINVQGSSRGNKLLLDELSTKKRIIKTNALRKKTAPFGHNAPLKPVKLVNGVMRYSEWLIKNPTLKPDAPKLKFDLQQKPAGENKIRLTLTNTSYLIDNTYLIDNITWYINNKPEGYYQKGSDGFKSISRVYEYGEVINAKIATKWFDTIIFSENEIVTLASEPVADFDAEITGPENGKFKIVFTSKSTENVRTLTWKFGDEAPITMNRPDSPDPDSEWYKVIREYTEEKRFTATLEVEGLGGKATHSEEISVSSEPVADFDAEITEPEDGKFKIVFTNNSTENIRTLTWKFGDEAPITMNRPDSPDPDSEWYKVIREYTEEKRFTATLEVEGLGGKATHSEEISVSSEPVADFDAEITEPEDGKFKIVFTNNSTENIRTLTWKFGDETPITLNRPDSPAPDSEWYKVIREYTEEKRFTATLEVEGLGGKATHSEEISVSSEPVADFDAEITEPEDGKFKIVFTNNSTENIRTLTWKFGDETPITLNRPDSPAPDSEWYKVIREYTEEKRFTATLEVEGLGGKAICKENIRLKKAN